MSSIVRIFKITADAPSLQDNIADLDRLRAAIDKVIPDDRKLTIPFKLCSSVANCFRNNDFKGSVVLNDLPSGWVLQGVLKDEPKQLLAIALDLGSTHLEASMVDLLTGDILFTAGAPNEQLTFGADILNRIHYATVQRRKVKNWDSDFVDPGLLELQQVIIDCINKLIDKLAANVKLKAEHIWAIAISGNTTMTHFLLGLDPYNICREPYVPLANFIEPIDAKDLLLNINPYAPVWIMPSVASYFGGDLISGIIASGMTSSEKPRMLIDVGTNAEVVLGNKDWLLACAGAAGPALEGGVAKMGMRASPGAIEYISIDPKEFIIDYKTIGNKPARGLCGSGMIDLVAALYLARIIDIRGKFRNPEKEKNALRAKFLKDRLVKKDGQIAFVVVNGSLAYNNEPVYLEQIDLDAMMRSKAAMYAILTTLINQVGLEFEDLEEICVAGAFGGHINPERAKVVGMLPDIDISLYRGIGNSSLAGAVMILLDRQKRLDSLTLNNKITYLELNVNQEFMIRFSGSRFIPHTDPKLFPTVPNFFGKE